MLEDENELAIDWGARAMMLAESLGKTEIFLHALRASRLTPKRDARIRSSALMAK